MVPPMPLLKVKRVQRLSDVAKQVVKQQAFRVLNEKLFSSLNARAGHNARHEFPRHYYDTIGVLSQALVKRHRPGRKAKKSPPG